MGMLRNILNYSMNRGVKEHRESKNINNAIEYKMGKQENEASNIAFGVAILIKNKLLANEFEVISYGECHGIVVDIGAITYVISNSILNEKIKELLGNQYSLKTIEVKYGTLNHICYIECSKEINYERLQGI